ncbi:hypothetical protein QD840_001970 [Citrobacter koseri]|nr:hypothetical protein [Citrobacter koseri]HEM8493082.1 hypothetical protein [Citrobacter koseri]
MRTTDLALEQLTKIADKAFQAETVCSLIEDHPHELTESQVIALASLIKTLAGDVRINMSEIIHQREDEQQ